MLLAVTHAIAVYEHLMDERIIVDERQWDDMQSFSVGSRVYVAEDIIDDSETRYIDVDRIPIVVNKLAQLSGRWRTADNEVAVYPDKFIPLTTWHVRERLLSLIREQPGVMFFLWLAPTTKFPSQDKFPPNVRFTRASWEDIELLSPRVFEMFERELRMAAANGSINPDCLGDWSLHTWTATYSRDGQSHSVRYRLPTTSLLEAAKQIQALNQDGQAFLVQVKRDD